MTRRALVRCGSGRRVLIASGGWAIGLLFGKKINRRSMVTEEQANAVLNRFGIHPNGALDKLPTTRAA